MVGINDQVTFLTGNEKQPRDETDNPLITCDDNSCFFVVNSNDGTRYVAGQQLYAVLRHDGRSTGNRSAQHRRGSGLLGADVSIARLSADDW